VTNRKAREISDESKTGATAGSINVLLPFIDLLARQAVLKSLSAANDNEPASPSGCVE